jgi:hypothetical protein
MCGDIDANILMPGADVRMEADIKTVNDLPLRIQRCRKNPRDGSAGAASRFEKIYKQKLAVIIY